MALAACDWEIRTDGDDGNGGGFERGASGTDYCQQAAAQKSGADLEIHASTNTDVKPTAAGVAAADVGNLVRISAGTGWTAGWYSIKSIQGDYWRLDRSPSAAGNANLGTYKMGGALASLGGFGAIIVADTTNHRANDHSVFIREGTYPLTSSGYNTPGGPLRLDNDSYGTAVGWMLIGCATSARYPNTGWDQVKPRITNPSAYNLGTNGLMRLTVGAIDRLITVNNIALDVNQSDTNGFVCASTNDRVQLYACEVTGAFKAFEYAYAINCEVRDSLRGFAVSRSIRCKTIGCYAGFEGGDVKDCSAAGSTLYAFYRVKSASGCVAINSTSNHFWNESTSHPYLVEGCVLANCGGYAFDGRSARILRTSFSYNHTSGLINNALSRYYDDITSLTSNPFLCPVSQTAVAYTASTRTLTKAGAFTEVGVGYRINITSGTGITPGKYWIASKTSDDAVVLAKSPGASDAADVVIDYDFQLNRVAGGGKELREMVDDNGGRPFGYWSSDPALPDEADVKVDEEYGDGNDEYTGTLSGGGSSPRIASMNGGLS